MYITASYGYRGLKITTMRAYTNEEELANFLRRCRRTAIQQCEQNVERFSREHSEYARSSLAYARQSLQEFQNCSLEDFLTAGHHPTIYFCEDNPVDPRDSGRRANQRLGSRQLVERLRNANVRLDDRARDIPLPEDFN